MLSFSWRGDRKRINIYGEAARIYQALNQSRDPEATLRYDSKFVIIPRSLPEEEIAQVLDELINGDHRPSETLEELLRRLSDLDFDDLIVVSEWMIQLSFHGDGINPRGNSARIVGPLTEHGFGLHVGNKTRNRRWWTSLEAHARYLIRRTLWYAIYSHPGNAQVHRHRQLLRHAVEGLRRKREEELRRKRESERETP